MSFDDLDRIIVQGKELGIYMYIYSGGEPLVRKDDLIKLAEKHNEALKSPLFMQYKMNQPFNENHLRPCPLLDNPDKLKQMVHESGAKSTQFLVEESVDDLTDKCQDVSRKWAETADRLKAQLGETGCG